MLLVMGVAVGVAEERMVMPISRISSSEALEGVAQYITLLPPDKVVMAAVLSTLPPTLSPYPEAFRPTPAPPAVTQAVMLAIGREEQEVVPEEV